MASLDSEENTPTFETKDWFKEAERFPEFSQDEIRVFIEAFKTYDKDGSGAIDETELGDALKAMGHGAEPDEVSFLLLLLGGDETGQMEWPGFLALMRLLYPDKRVQYVKRFLQPARNFPEFTKGDIKAIIQSFREFDLDSSGAINAYELDKAFQLMGQGMDPDSIDEIIRTFDNGKGEIEFEGFLELMRSLYPEKRFAFVRKFYGEAQDFPEFSRDDVDTFVQAFRDFDFDDSNTIDAEELEECLFAMGQGVSPQESQLMIDLVDEEGNGDVNWKGFLRIMRFCYPEKRIKFVKEFYGAAQDFPEFSAADIEIFIKAFRQYDLDGSGAIDADELLIALFFMGQGASPDDVQALIKEVDFDNTGQVEWRKFLMILRKLYPEKLEEYQKKWYTDAKNFPQFSKEDIDVFIRSFRLYDLDDSGSIDIGELLLAFWSMGQGVAPDEVQTLIEKYDANGSGEIDWPEFLQMMSEIYSGKDIFEPVKKESAVTESPSTSSFQTAKPAATNPAATSPATSPATVRPSTSKVMVGTQRGNPKCESCGKTVYPLEAISAGERTWHKGCFRCEAEGCTLTLNLQTYTAVQGNIYCSKHVPKEKHTSVPVGGSLLTSHVTSVPKLSKVQGIQRDARLTFGPGEAPYKGQ